ncbi:MAG: hypothetical protein LBV08_01450 [Clostridiales bacterium]|jgi:hypothetical protein|nr:hypothetical protein [Clostridiales bacterium]
MKKNTLLALLPMLLFGAYRLVSKKQGDFAEPGESQAGSQGEDSGPFLFEQKKAFKGVKIPNKYFRNVDIAILYFFDNLKREEIHKALGCFTKIKSGEDIYFVNKVFYNGEFNPDTEYPLEYNIYRDLKELSILNERALGVLGFITSLVLNEDNPINSLKKNGNSFLVESFEDARIVFENLNTKYLKTIDVLEIDVPSSELMNSDAPFNYYRREASLNGALDKTERTVLFTYDNNQYFISFTLVKFEEGWKIDNFGAELSLNTPPGHFVCYRVNKEEYFELIK